MASLFEFEEVRRPAVAGTFYPAAPEELAAAVDAFLADVPASAGAPPKAVVVPHAGYVYSGPIAASAYAALRPLASRVTCVVMVGPAHRARVEGLASPGARALRTPLGDIPVDLDALAAIPSVVSSPRAHAREHSLEVQLPFVQRVLPRARIVPLVVGYASAEHVGRVLETLWGGEETVVVVSSDLSHYLPYAQGRLLDEDTARRIVALEGGLVGEDACGCAGINGLLWLARRRGLEARVIDLRSSGDTAGSRDAVVGYGAFGFYERDPRALAS